MYSISGSVSHCQIQYKFHRPNCKTHHVDGIYRQGLSRHQAVSLHLVLYCLGAERDQITRNSQCLYNTAVALSPMSNTNQTNLSHGEEVLRLSPIDSRAPDLLRTIVNTMCVQVLGTYMVSGRVKKDTFTLT